MPIPFIHKLLARRATNPRIKRPSKTARNGISAPLFLSDDCGTLVVAGSQHANKLTWLFPKLVQAKRAGLYDIRSSDPFSNRARVYQAVAAIVAQTAPTSVFAMPRCPGSLLCALAGFDVVGGRSVLYLEQDDPLTNHETQPAGWVCRTSK